MAGLTSFTHRIQEDVMKIRTALPAIAVILVFGAAPSLASAPRSDPGQPDTPSSCIKINHGDWNACNVGNSGRGDLPYKLPSRR